MAPALLSAPEPHLSPAPYLLVSPPPPPTAFLPSLLPTPEAALPQLPVHISPPHPTTHTHAHTHTRVCTHTCAHITCTRAHMHAHSAHAHSHTCTQGTHVHMHAHNVCTHTQTGLQCEPQLVAQAKTPRPLGILGSIISSDRSGGRLGRWNLVGLGGLSMAGVSHATTVIVLAPAATGAAIWPRSLLPDPALHRNPTVTGPRRLPWGGPTLGLLCGGSLVEHQALAVGGSV